MRSFDPMRVGELECDSWVAYYQRRWLSFLRAALAAHYSHVYSVPLDSVQPAAKQRAQATFHSDRWVARAARRTAP